MDQSKTRREKFKQKNLFEEMSHIKNFDQNEVEIIEKQTSQINMEHKKDGKEFENGLSQLEIEHMNTPKYNGIEIKQEDLHVFGVLVINQKKKELLNNQNKMMVPLLEILLTVSSKTERMRQKRIVKKLCSKILSKDTLEKHLFIQAIQKLYRNKKDEEDFHVHLKILKLIITSNRELSSEYTKDFLIFLGRYYTEKNHRIKESAKTVLFQIFDRLSTEEVLLDLKNFFYDLSRYKQLAMIISVLSVAKGFENMIQLFNFLFLNLERNPDLIFLALEILSNTINLMGEDSITILEKTITILKPIILLQRDPKDRNYSLMKIKCINVLNKLLEQTTPFGLTLYINILENLWMCVLRNSDSVSYAYMNLIINIIKTMPIDLKKGYSIMAIKRIEVSFPISYFFKTISMTIINLIANCDFELDTHMKIFSSFLHCYFNKEYSTEFLSHKLLCNVLSVFGVLIGKERTILHLERHSKLQTVESVYFNALLFNTISEILSTKNPNNPDSECSERLSNFISNLVLDLFENSKIFQIAELENFTLLGIKNLFKSRILTHLLNQNFDFREKLMNLCLSKISNNSCEIKKANLSTILAIIKSTEMFLKKHEDPRIYPLEKLFLVLMEYCNHEPWVLSLSLRCLAVILEKLGSCENYTGIIELEESFQIILSFIHHKDQNVQKNVLKLTLILCQNKQFFIKISQKLWLRTLYMMIEIIKVANRKTRILAIAIFKIHSSLLNPMEIINILLDLLSREKNIQRNFSASSFSVLSTTIGTYITLPFLLFEYQKQRNLTIRNSILKTISLIFDEIEEKTTDYVSYVIPLLNHSLTDHQVTHRIFSLNLVKSIALNSFGYLQHSFAIHILNFVWPNLFKTCSSELEKIVFDCLDALRLVTGEGVILLYLLSGLFHPAKNVRSTMWKLYFRLCRKKPSSLIPFYPMLMNEIYKDGFLILGNESNLFEIEQKMHFWKLKIRSKGLGKNDDYISDFQKVQKSSKESNFYKDNIYMLLKKKQFFNIGLNEHELFQNFLVDQNLVLKTYHSERLNYFL